MIEPTLLLQSGPYMKTEKTACAFSNYPVRYCSFEDIDKLEPEEVFPTMVPVGTVEYVTRYCEHVGITVPDDFSYFYNPPSSYLHRKVRKGFFQEAKLEEFVKPCKTKRFTGDIKANLTEEVPPQEEVWISEAVPFESEFRFYIHDFVTGPKILGWARYDSLQVVNPEPDFDLVESIMYDFHKNLGPLGYAVDIGWRKDLQKYSLVEINDGWSLGYYEHTNSQSNPPTRQSYADLLVSRWGQIVFCSLI